MIETLWIICGWTGFAWWSGVIIAGTAIACSAVVESLCVRWEEDEIRRIASLGDGGTGSTERLYAETAVAVNGTANVSAGVTAGEYGNLPANWQELDSYASWLEACAEMRRRMDDGA